jgi:hypothetical protein
MALYWHPFLAEMLRQSYGDRLIIHETVSLGDLPLEADLLLIRRDPSQPLPFPFAFLGERTLVEYKSPDEAGDQTALQQLETYGMLWLQREGLTQRQALTLWLVASRFGADVSQRGGAEIVQQFEAGPGVIGGRVDGFPTYLVDLQDVPFSPATMPLHVVSRGRQEQSLVEYVIDHRQDQPLAMQLVQRLHAQVLLEVLRMRNLTPEQLGLDYEAMLELIGRERALKWIGRQEVLDMLGKDQALDMIGKDQALDMIGEDAVRRWLARRHPTPPSPTEPPPTAP